MKNENKISIKQVKDLQKKILHFFFFFFFVIVWSDIVYMEKQISQRLIRAYNIAMVLSCVLCPKALLPRCSKLLSIFLGGRSHFSLNFIGQLGPLGYSTKYQQSYASMIFFFLFIYLFYFIFFIYLFIYLFYYFILFYLFFFFFVIPLTVYIRSTELYRGQFTCYILLPRAYNAPLGGALVKHYTGDQQLRFKI